MAEAIGELVIEAATFFVAVFFIPILIGIYLIAYRLIVGHYPPERDSPHRPR